MSVKDILADHGDEIKRRFGVRRIGLFGSCARGEETGSSDVDILVEFEHPDFDNYMELAFYLEDLLGRHVDLLTPEGVRSIRVGNVAENIRREIVYV